MIAHQGPISGIAAYSNEYVATAGYDNQVILWDQRSKTPLARVFHDHLANQCAFSPDGRWLITSSSDYTARLWDVPELKLAAVLGDHEDDVEMSVFHPSKHLVATASRDHRVRVYDFSGRLEHRFAGHEADVISVEWVEGADAVITSSDDGTVKRWSLLTSGLVEDIDLGGVETDTVVVGPDGTIYAGNDSGEIVILREDARETISAHAAGIKRLALSADRQLLVSLSYDRTMRLWHLARTGLAQIDQAELPHDVWPRSCAFAAGTTLVLGTFGSTYRTYDYRLGAWLDEEVPATAGVNAACALGNDILGIGDAGVAWRFTQAGQTRQSEPGSLCNFLTPVADMVITGGQLGRAFDAVTGRIMHQHRSPLNCAASFTRDGVAHVVIGAYTGEGIVLRPNAASGTMCHLEDLPLHANAVKGLAVSGSWLFSVCADGSAAWHDLESGKRVRHQEDAHEKIANGCTGLGGGRFASVSRDLKLRIWEPDGSVSCLRTPHTHSIKCVAADPTGQLIATGSYDGHVAIYDTVQRQWPVAVRPTAHGISSLAWHPARKLFLASSYDGQVHEVGCR